MADLVGITSDVWFYLQQLPLYPDDSPPWSWSWLPSKKVNLLPARKNKSVSGPFFSHHSNSICRHKLGSLLVTSFCITGLCCTTSLPCRSGPGRSGCCCWISRLALALAFSPRFSPTSLSSGWLVVVAAENPNQKIMNNEVTKGQFNSTLSNYL